MRAFFILLCLLPFSLGVQAADAPKIIVSILPLHAIATAVMGDQGSPTLLLPGRLGEHRATFSPRQIAEIAAADAVFLVSPGLEAKLAQMSGGEAVGGKTFIFLAEAPGVERLAARAGGIWATHSHDSETDEDHQEEGVLAYDPHVWLDPENAKAMARAMASHLARLDATNAATYIANSDRFAASIDSLSAEIVRALAPLRDKRFVVFHDAFQYFEKRFDLVGGGSIADVSAAPPSARRLNDIKRMIAEDHVVCVFREPQYDDRFVRAAIEDSGARPGVLDPIGAELEPGAGAYGLLLTGLAHDFAACMR